MISLVICSINENYLQQLQKNVEATIGVEYELLFFDNIVEKKGICEVYNLLAEKTRFGIICFLHEDIIFQGTGWGRRLIDHFNEDNSIGAIGVAGAKYKSAHCSGWYTGIPDLDCAHILHRYPDRDEQIHLSPANKSMEEVVCLDGVFIATRKSIWEKIRFDATHLSGFHFYDLDISLRINVEYRCMVAYDIQIIHLTKGGDFGNNWLEIALDFHSRFQGLPSSCLEKLPPATDRRIIITWFNVLKHQHISFKNKWKWISSQHLWKPVYAYSILKLFLYKPLGLHMIHKKS